MLAVRPFWPIAMGEQTWQYKCSKRGMDMNNWPFKNGDLPRGIMLERHALSAAFPDMEEQHFDELVQSIKEHGQREPITLYQNKILDGWHRYRACELLQIGPMTTTFDGSDPVSFVLDLNIHRRHMTPSQKAMAVVTVNTWAAVGTNQKQTKGKKAKTDGQDSGTSGSATGRRLKTAKELATEAGVGTRTIERAKLVADEGDDDLKQKVIAGVVNLKEAVDLVRKVDPQPEEKPADPRPKLTIEKQKYDDLKAAFDQLQEDYDALRQNCKDLGDELAILKSIEQDEAAAKMRQMLADIKILTEQRDRWQNQCAEMQKQINYLKKHAVRKSA